MTSSQPSHPFSSISLSPEGTYAVASGRDVLHVLRVGGLGSNKLEEIRSVRIAQHFQANGINRGPTTSSIQNSSQYTHMHDVLRIPNPNLTPGGGRTTGIAAGGGGGGVNVNVTDVAWSLPQSFVLDNGSVGSGTSSGKGVTDSVGGLGECSPTFAYSSMDALDSADQSSHHPPFINRVHAKTKEYQTSSYVSPLGNESSPTPIDDSSVVAAAGSNGVIVAWHARSLLGGGLTSPTRDAMTPGRHDRWGGSNNANNAAQVTSAATIGQPEAIFLAHSRAINRLAWHPTGRRPYLLLSGSQDGLVKLWDRRATSFTSAASNIVANRSTWFGFGGSSSTKQVPNPFTQSTTITTANWHCCSTYQPKCEAVRDIKWSPFIDDIFAMVAGEWLLAYDIRLPNRPMIKESAHAGEATSVDWHPTQRYKIATGGSRDRCVKVWNIESGLNIYKQDDNASYNLKTNSGSYKSDISESVSITSSEGITVANSKKDTDIGDIRGIQAANHATLGSTISSGSSSPMKRIASGDRFRTKKNLPLHVLSVSSPVTRIRWRPPEEANDCEDDYHESMIAVATSPISGANAGGNGVIGLWSCHRPFMPISVCEGHVDGAVIDFAWATETEDANFERKWQTVITVGRDGQCLLQNFSQGHFPINEVPCSTFALTNLSPFQPGFGSLQIIAVHQHVNAVGVVRGETAPSPISNSELAFSVTDQGDLKDLSGEAPDGNGVDIAPEVTHLSRLSEMYITKTGGCFQTKVDTCNHNADVAEGLNRKALTQMWKTLAIILKGSGLDDIPSSASPLPNNPMAHAIIPTLEKLLLQRADAGDVQSCVVLCEVMGVIVPPAVTAGVAKSRLPNLSIEEVREWYLSYIDLLQQMCLFTQAASLIKNCNDPVVGSLNQQSTTIHESCPVCGKPLQGGGASSCRSCRRKVGTCFICHESVKGMFVWCPGCGHGGHLDHALEWFGKNEFCPTGCGHKCNLFPNK